MDWPRIDRITARAKSVERFIQKALKKNDAGVPKYTDPLRQVQDQIGCRVVAFYHPDVQRISEHVLRYVRPIESTWFRLQLSAEPTHACEGGRQQDLRQILRWAKITKMAFKAAKRI